MRRLLFHRIPFRAKPTNRKCAELLLWIVWFFSSAPLSIKPCFQTHCSFKSPGTSLVTCGRPACAASKNSVNTLRYFNHFFTFLPYLLPQLRLANKQKTTPPPQAKYVIKSGDGPFGIIWPGGYESRLKKGIKTCMVITAFGFVLTGCNSGMRQGMCKRAKKYGGEKSRWTEWKFIILQGGLSWVC